VRVSMRECMHAVCHPHAGVCVCVSCVCMHAGVSVHVHACMQASVSFPASRNWVSGARPGLRTHSFYWLGTATSIGRPGCEIAELACRPAHDWQGQTQARLGGQDETLFRLGSGHLDHGASTAGAWLGGQDETLLLATQDCILISTK
jgi:hypothetical protein